MNPSKTISRSKKQKDPVAQKVKLINNIFERLILGEDWKWVDGMLQHHWPKMCFMIQDSDDPNRYIDMISQSLKKQLDLSVKLHSYAQLLNAIIENPA